MDAVAGAPRRLVVIAEPQPPELPAHQVLAEHRNRQVAVAHVGHLFLERVGVDVASALVHHQGVVDQPGIGELLADRAVLKDQPGEILGVRRGVSLCDQTAVRPPEHDVRRVDPLG